MSSLTSAGSGIGSPFSSATASATMLDVEVVADRGDVAGLVGAEQVARAADLEVAHRDLEPRAELGLLADRPQPLVGLLGQHPVARVEQVRVRALAGPPDAAAQLVQLAEAEQVGAVDDEGVHRRHVDPRLDDRRADEHVVATLGEVEHDLLEGSLVHLAVRDDDARLGHELARGRAATRSMSWTRLCTKKTWPSRSSSRRIASATARSSSSPT